MIEEELVEKFKDYNIFIGNIIRAPKVKKRSKGEQSFLVLISSKPRSNLVSLDYFCKNID